MTQKKGVPCQSKFILYLLYKLYELSTLNYFLVSLKKSPISVIIHPINFLLTHCAMAWVLKGKKNVKLHIDLIKKM